MSETRRQARQAASASDERDERLRALERLLRSTPGGLTPPEIAETLGSSLRTAQRDLATLRDDAGLPIVVAGGRYEIFAGSYPLTPIELTMEDATGLILAARLLEGLPGRGARLALAAIARLEGALPAHVAAALGAEQPHTAGEARSEVLRVLAEAWAARRTVTIRRRDPREPFEQVGTLDPYLITLAPGGDGIAVVGLSHEDRAIRSYRVDRIRDAALTAEHFALDPAVVRRLAAQTAWAGTERKAAGSRRSG